MKTIKNMQEHSSPREKPRQKGASALSDGEFVVVILGLGTPVLTYGRSVNRLPVSFVSTKRLNQELIARDNAQS